MPYGSGCLGSVYNNNVQLVPLGAAITFEKNTNLLNVSHILNTDQIIVRQSGYFAVVFVVTTDEPCQFGIFINGVVEDSTVTGNNVGANQLVIRHMLLLKKMMF
jgi:hypothetical protein